MIEVIFTACMILAPEQCTEVRVPPPIMRLNELTCLSTAQAAVAEKMLAYPGYRVTRFGCVRER